MDRMVIVQLYDTVHRHEDEARKAEPNQQTKQAKTKWQGRNPSF